MWISDLAPYSSTAYLWSAANSDMALCCQSIVTLPIPQVAVSKKAQAPTYGYGGRYTTAMSQSEAYALDAADGVIDGKFFGSQV